MANEANVAANPDGQQLAGAADTNTRVTPANDGARADTSRVADDLGGKPVGGQDQQQAKSFSYKEDRSDWIPRNRLNEESGKRQKLEQQVAAMQATLEQNEKRLRAALGIEAPSKEEAEAAEIREALLKVYPNLRILERLNEEQLEELLASGQAAQSASRAQWSRHASEMQEDLQDVASDLLNVDKLTDQQAKRLWRAFREEAREHARARARAEQTQDPAYDFDNDFVARYERGDRTLLEEFAKSFYEEWVQPARRQATASAVTRGNRPVPRGERTRQVVAQGPPKIDYNDDDAFKKAMLEARRGGQVGE